MSCHKAIVVITRRAHCFHESITVTGAKLFSKEDKVSLNISELNFAKEKTEKAKKLNKSNSKEHCQKTQCLKNSRHFRCIWKNYTSNYYHENQSTNISRG